MPPPQVRVANANASGAYAAGVAIVVDRWYPAWSQDPSRKHTMCGSLTTSRWPACHWALVRVRAAQRTAALPHVREALQM